MNEKNIVKNVYEESAVKLLVLRISFGAIYNTYHPSPHINWIRWNIFGESNRNLDIDVNASFFFIVHHRRRTTTITTTKMYNSKGVSFKATIFNSAVYLYLVFCIGVEAGNGNFFVIPTIYILFIHLWK